MTSKEVVEISKEEEVEETSKVVEVEKDVKAKINLRIKKIKKLLRMINGDNNNNKCHRLKEEVGDNLNRLTIMLHKPKDGDRKNQRHKEMDGVNKVM